MEKAKKEKIDPGFWIGLIMVVGLIFATIKCS